MEVGRFIFLYLLLPILGFVLGLVMFIIAKKNKLISNKKAVYYFLATCIILALPALLGFINYWFMPYAYVSMQVVYLVLGWFNLKVLNSVVRDLKEKPYYIEFLIILVVMLISAGVFSLVFNLCNELQYGIWACTCILPFIFVSLFKKAYKSYLAIPLEVYKIWSYNREEQEARDEYFDSNEILVVELELFKQVTDTEPLNIKAKSSDKIPFGLWFQIFLNDYNKKSPLSPIAYTDAEESYGWIFYVTTPFLARRKYIDPDLSFVENKIKDKHVIMAKRVQYEENDEV